MVRIKNLILRSDGVAPRKMLQPILVSRDCAVRPLFRRLFYKKNGTPRSEYSVWLRELDTSKRAASFDRSMGQIRFFPEFGDVRRLNLILSATSGTAECLSLDERNLQFACMHAEKRSYVLRVFGNKCSFSSDWIFSRVAVSATALIGVEIVTLVDGHLTVVTLGDEDRFIDGQQIAWRNLTGGLDIDRQCEQLSTLPAPIGLG